MKTASKITKSGKTATVKPGDLLGTIIKEAAAALPVTAPAKADDSAIRFLQVASCASASGKSQLTYRVDYHHALFIFGTMHVSA